MRDELFRRQTFVHIPLGTPSFEVLENGLKAAIKAKAVVVDTLIEDACGKWAEDSGLTDLYLVNADFVREAVREKVLREGRCGLNDLWKCSECGYCPNNGEGGDGMMKDVITKHDIYLAQARLEQCPDCVENAEGSCPGVYECRRLQAAVKEREDDLIGKVQGSHFSE